MAEFTKWIKVGFFIFTIEKPPRMVADISTINFSLSQAEANANLISAAPALHESLLDFTLAYRRGLKVEQTRAYKKAMKALALVEGK